MIDGALRAVAVAATLLVALGFAMFAVDELRDATRSQHGDVATVTDDGPSHGVRKAVEDAASALVGPFEGLVPSRSPWIREGVPALLALLVYGVGLGFVARYLRSRN